MSALCPVAVPLEALNEPQAETASEAFLSFLKKKRLCDVTFVFKNAPDKIEAHQFCLRARSPVFHSMFRGLGSVASMQEIKIEDASPDIVEKFLEFIYADKFDVTATQAFDLLHLGHKYKVQPLVNKCAALIAKGISTENAIEIEAMAEKYELKDLRAMADDFIASSLEEFIQDPNMMKIKDTTLIGLLKRSDLTVKETDLFQLAVKWGTDNSNGNHEQAVRLTRTLLPFIRFTNMTPKEFTTLVLPTNVLPAEDVIKIFAYMNGDDLTRNSILPSLKYDISLRNVEEEPKCEELVTFVSEYKTALPFQQVEAAFPFRECISTSGIGSCNKEGKKFKIRNVIVRWPTRRVYGKNLQEQPPAPVNFRVLVMGKHSSHELYTTKFDTAVYDCSSDGRKQTVNVEPPVEMSNDFDYCIAIKDEHSRLNVKKFTYYHGHGNYEVTANLDDFILENKDLELQIRGTKRNDCPKALSTSSNYNAVHVIRDICFVMD